MAGKNLHKIIGRAVIDKDFRQQLHDDPDAALADYDLSKEEIQALKNLANEGFDDLAGTLGERISRLGLSGFISGPGSSST